MEGTSSKSVSVKVCAVGPAPRQFNPHYEAMLDLRFRYWDVRGFVSELQAPGLRFAVRFNLEILLATRDSFCVMMTQTYFTTISMNNACSGLKKFFSSRALLDRVTLWRPQ